jgi:glycosyltransferase involved in cell wall biosynthesis
MPTLDSTKPATGSPPSAAPPSVPLSVIMPAYNEEGAIEDAVGDVREHVFAAVPEAELVVVDDGSRDRTGAILDGLAAHEPRLRVIHKPNGGHGPALRTGLDAASGEYVFLVDSDRQVPLSAFPALWEAAKGRDGAFGVRKTRNDARIRLALTAVVRTALRPLLGVRIYDANVPFKIVRRVVWEEAKGLIPADTLAPSLFLAVYMARRGCDVAQVEVPHKDRETGTVSIRRWKLLKFCARAFRQLLAFRARLNSELKAERLPAVGSC